MADLTLLIVDDEALIRAGLRLLLDGTPGLRVVGEAEDGRRALARAAELKPDLILMDVRMPTMDGLEATRQLLRSDTASKVLVLTTFDTDDTVLEALRVGAIGFLLKDTPPRELIEVIRQAGAGRIVLSPEVTRKLIDHAVRGPGADRRHDARDRLSRLTERELELAKALARGASNVELAAQLFISLATVKTHVGSIMTKVGASNRVQVALCVYEAEAL